MALKNIDSVNLDPEWHTICRKYISAERPSELERFTSVLSQMGVKYKCLVYSDNSKDDYQDAGFRVDIVMEYKKMYESDILAGLGLKYKDLYLYFHHS